MIYSNFLFFIIAIVVFSTAHDTDQGMLAWQFDLLSALALFAGFWLMNRVRFLKLRADYDCGQISAFAARRFYSRTVVVQSILGVVLFSAAVVFFDLKSLVRSIPFLGQSEFVVGLAGVAFFALFFSCVWYWGFRSLGREMETATTAKSFVIGNIRFYLAIVVPWLLLSLVADLLGLLDGPFMEILEASLFYQLVLLALFIVAAAWLCPPIIVRLWECKPIEDRALESTIRSLVRDQGARFTKILSWDALNRSLVTAAVFGVLPMTRYLLITPSLMRLLNDEEIRAVVSHEIGHVKNRHLYLYFLFFLCFFVVAAGIIGLIIRAFLTTEYGLQLVMTPDGLIDPSILALPQITVMLVLFVLFFRFVFGFFMRNFERQADVYCFQTDVDPRHLLSSFEKLNQTMGSDRERKNWHHFTIAERMAFVREALHNPGVIQKHQRKLRRNLALFFSSVAALVCFSLTPLGGRMNAALDLNFFEKVIIQRVALEPESSELVKTLANIQFEMEKFAEAKLHFEKALKLDPQDPVLANNFAWLLLTCEDEELLDAPKALALAEAACAVEQRDFMLDTLAEAYFQNGRLDDALHVAQQAYDLSDKSDHHFANQLEKMRKAIEDRAMEN